MFALSLLFLAPLAISSVSAINVPYTHSLNKRNSRAGIPRTLLDRSEGGLAVRQTATCDVGTTPCTGGGCCDGSCCGDGCCPGGFVCNFVGNTPACCPVGETCSNQISGCTDSTLVECTGYDFCCPAGQACSLDPSGNAECGGVVVGTGNGTGNTNTGNGNTGNGNTGNGNTGNGNTGNSGLSSLENGINSATNIFNSVTAAVNSFNGGNPTPTTTTSTHHGIFGGAAHVGVSGAMLGVVAGFVGVLVL